MTDPNAKTWKQKQSDYRVRCDEQGQYHAEMLYDVPVVKMERTWVALNNEGYWADPNISMGFGSDVVNPMTHDEAKQAVWQAMVINRTKDTDHDAG